MLTQSARLSAMTHYDHQAEVCCAIYCLWIRRLMLGQPLREAWIAALNEARAHSSRGSTSSDTPGPAPMPHDFWPRLEGVEALSYDQLQPSGYAGYVVECLEAAVWCCLHSENLEETLIQAVNLAGEADTIAAVAGGAAGAYWGKRAIPQRWLDALHQLDRLELAAGQLAANFLRQHSYEPLDTPPFGFNWVGSRLYAGRNPLTLQDQRSCRHWHHRLSGPPGGLGVCIPTPWYGGIEGNECSRNRTPARAD